MSDIPEEIQQAVDSWDGRSEPPEQIQSFFEGQDAASLPDKLQQYLSISKTSDNGPSTQSADDAVPAFQDDETGVA